MLVMGGAIGNLIDRLRIGYVIDFVEWFYGDFTWPNFNVADVGISVGVGLLLLDSLLARDDAPEAKPEAKPEPDPPPANG
jgi:signal peptidase II